jgi:uroporphyrinogen decarboxylase
MGQKEKMSSRERVLAAMNHKEPDRVPIEFGGGVSNFHEDVYRGLEEYIQVGFWKQWTSNWGAFKVDERVLDRLHVDFRHIWFAGGGAKTWNPVEIFHDGTYTDFWGIRYKAIDHVYSNIVGNPLKNAKSVKDVEKYFKSLPDPKTVGKQAAEGLKEEVEYYKNKTQFAIKGEPMWSHFELAQWLRGMADFFVDMIENKELAFAILDHLYNYQAKMYEEYFRVVGKHLDVLWTSDDYGAQDGMLISRKDFISFVKPWAKKRLDYIKERAPQAKVFHHTCGSAYDIIPDLIEIGNDGLNPLQPFAKNMEPERLKKEFGGKLFFLGGLDHQFILSKPPDEVKTFVDRLLKAYSPGGGFILGPTHVVPSNARIDSIISACDYAVEVSKHN